MKKFFILLLVLVGASAIYWMVSKQKSKKVDTAEKPIVQSKHSAAFNNSIEALMHHYISAKNGLIAADTAKVKSAVRDLVLSLASINLKELEKDTSAIVQTVQGSMSDIQSNATSLLSQKNIEEMRKDFSMLTNVMFPAFFTSINYEGRRYYFLRCPNAFGDMQEGNWLSETTTGGNPLSADAACVQLVDSTKGS